MYQIQIEISLFLTNIKIFVIFKNCIIFKTPFDKNFINSNEIIVSSFKNLQLDYKSINCKNNFNIFQIQNNIGSLLVHNKSSFNFNYKSLTKDVIKPIFQLFFFKKFKISIYLPILTDASCLSTKVVNFLCFNKCNIIYSRNQEASKRQNFRAFGEY